MSRVTQTMQSGAFVLSALALMLVPVFAIAPSVYANDDADSSQSTEAEYESSESAELEAETELETETLQQKIRERKQEVKNEAQQSVERLRQKAEDKADRTQERRLKICENRKTSIDNKLGAFRKTGQNKLERLNTAFEKLQAYQADNNITVYGFDELVATATDTQSTATADVAVLTSLIDEGIDCSSSNIADQIGGVKEAGMKARESLRAYRGALHDMLVSILQATIDTTETPEGDA